MTSVVVDDHPAIVAGVEMWCAAANPPVRVLDAGARAAVAWTAPGSDADVVVFDLQQSGQVSMYRDLRQLVEVGRLEITVRTVNSYIDRARIKYADAGRSAPTKAALVARAIQDGFVRLEDL
ncbi:hypothetical protein ABZ816_39565 [Actinosynnema sp. NPDC047251]